MNPKESPLQNNMCVHCGAERANFDPGMHLPECAWARSRRVWLERIDVLIKELTSLRCEAYDQHVRALDEAIVYLHKRVR